MFFTLPLKEQALLSTLLTQPHRYYHNIIHVNDCLSELYKWGIANSAKEGEYSFGEALTYAVWYHDAIYNPYAPPNVNESQSAKLYMQSDHYKAYAPVELDDENRFIRSAIERTARHTETQSFDNGWTPRYGGFCSLVLDIDLAGLGKSPHIFARNSVNIRKEYHASTDREVIQGRLKFFQKLNERSTFYYTKFFQDLYHEQSKKNVATEISLLEEAIERDDPWMYFSVINTTARLDR